MKLRSLLAALLLLPLVLLANLAQNDIDRLGEHRITSELGYWQEHVVAGGQCDGAKAGALLVELARL